MSVALIVLVEAYNDFNLNTMCVCVFSCVKESVHQEEHNCFWAPAENGRLCWAGSGLRMEFMAPAGLHFSESDIRNWPQLKKQ